MSAPPAQTYYLILPPQPPDVGSSIRPIARLVQEDEETIRRRLVTPSFQVLKRFARVQNAEGLQGQLHAFGIRTFIVSDTSIRATLFIWTKSARAGAGGMALTDFSGKPNYCPFNDVSGVSVMTIPRADGSSSVWLDMHRKSSPIVPRLDTAMFDFPTLLNRADATLDHFLTYLEDNTNLRVEQRFDAMLAQFRETVADFASAPGEFGPTPDALPSPYDRGVALAANLHSYLVQEERRSVVAAPA